MKAPHKAPGLTLGCLLHPEDQIDALNRSYNRMTFESITKYPESVSIMTKAGWLLSLISDADWLKSTLFVVDENGRLDLSVESCIHDHYQFRKELGKPA